METDEVVSFFCLMSKPPWKVTAVLGVTVSEPLNPTVWVTFLR